MKDKLLRIVDERKRDFLFIVLSLMLNVAVISIYIYIPFLTSNTVLRCFKPGSD